MVTYYFFLTVGILAVLASLYSLYLGVEYTRKVNQALARPKNGYRPRACLVIPCKGNEPNLEKNLIAALKQNYDNYQTIIITDNSQDPAYQIAEAVLKQSPTQKVQLCTSDLSIPASGKVAALLTALERTKGKAEVYAFLDSDSSVPPRWLGDLVDPLADETLGSTTGFRWYFPVEGFWSNVEAAWNASGTNLLFDEKYNFPWGGAMALRAETLDKIGIRQVWKNAISDDMTLNYALRAHGYRTLFLPQCTVATFNKTSLKSLLDWTTRQTLITKVFNRGLWNYARAAYTFFNLVFVLGLTSFAEGILAPVWFLPSFLLLTPTMLGFVRTVQRNRTFSRAIPEVKAEFERSRRGELLASFIVPWIMTYCIINSSRSKEIEWRGRKYQLTEMKAVATSRRIPQTAFR
jgi:cellulose synthase/poly-beta-1,6-N-acetylglucosamine synthase-like glycosyltransferase